MPDEKLARALRAKIRRDILHWLCDNQKRTVTEVAKKFSIKKPNASQHLTLLADLGLLGSEWDAPHKYYFIKMPEIKTLVEAYDKIVEKM